MPYLRDRVIVLKREPFREQDRRYWLYGREHGLLTAVARGAASSKSKQAGHLEPFSETEVMIAKGATFDKLAVATLCSAPIKSMSGLPAYSTCGSFAALSLGLLRPGVSDGRIFGLLREFMIAASRLPQVATVERARLLHAAGSLRLMDLLGFAPRIERAPDNATPLPALALASFMRRAPLHDVLRVTASTDVLRAASGFVEEALKQTHLEREPHGPATIAALV